LSRSYKQGYRVYDSAGIACSITSNGGGLGSFTGLYAVSAAIRGRYDENGMIQQQLEINDSDISNCITSVQKDSLVVEIEMKDDETYG